jgi:hypothetical protein
MQTLWLVGDRFGACAALGGVIALSDVWSMLERLKRAPAELSEPVRLELGQGLSRRELMQLKQQLLEPSLRGRVEAAEPIELSYPCDQRIVHKQHERNVMLESPTEVTSCEYRSRLRIDDECDDMADHQTGYHLAGALLAEAARQMVLAVSEKFLLPASARLKMQFITHSAKMAYHTYAFPFSVGITLVVAKLRRGAAGNFRADACIAFEQSARSVAQVDMSFSAMEYDFAHGQEGALAKLALGVGA